MRRPLRALVAVTAVASFAPATLLSAQPAERAVAEAAAAAAIVLRGHVQSRVAGVDESDGLIYTYTAVEVAEVLAGPAIGGRVVLKQAGGAIGRTAMVFTGMTGQLPGEEVVLFLDARRRDRTLYPIGPFGVGYVVRGSGPAEVLFDPAGVALRLPFDRVREQAQRDPGHARAATRIVAIPVETPPAALNGATAPGVTGALPSASRAVKWRAKDGFSYLSAGVFGWPFAQVTFGRWWPLTREIDVYRTSTGSDQYSFSVDENNLTRAVGAWSEPARRAARLRLIRGIARPHAECDGSFAEADTVSVTYKDECGEMGDGDPAFGLAGFVVDLGTSDAVKVNSRYHGPIVEFARIEWGVVHLNRGEQRYAGRAVNDYWRAGQFCQRQVLVHMLGHAMGLGDALLKGQHPESKTPAGANMMDATFHAVNATPQMSLACAGASGVGRTAPGGADLRGLGRMLRQPR